MLVARLIMPCKYFVRMREVGSVIELGCGDGNQLSVADYPSYIGLDVSRSAVELCQRRLTDDSTKSFFLYEAPAFRTVWAFSSQTWLSRSTPSIT